MTKIDNNKLCCCSVTKLCPTLCNPVDCSMLDSSVLHYLPGVCSNSCPLSWWCYLTVSSSVTPFSYCLQSFLALYFFPVSCLFASSGQSIGAGASASASVLPMNIQGWFPLGLTGLISLMSKGLSRVFLVPQFKTSILQCLAFFMVQHSHLYMTTGKASITLTIWTFVAKVMSLLFNILSRFVIAFLPSIF